VKTYLLLSAVVVLCACGPQRRPPPVEEDAGVDAGTPDAGRPRGDDPPSGWQQVLKLEADAGGRIGTNVVSAADRYGQPLVATAHFDPNGDGDGADTRILFTRWNGASRSFDPPVRVETVLGDLASASKPTRNVSLAYDRSTGRIGLAYLKAGEIRFAYSNDDGVTFSLQTVSAGSTTVSHPQLALRDDVTHLVFVQDGQLKYRKRTGISGAFADENGPAVNASTQAVDVAPSLALDEMGRPGIAYFVSEPSALTAQLAFWRPGTGMATEVASSGTVEVQGLRAPGVTLAFNGVQPRVAFHLRKVPPTAPDMGEELFFAQASNAEGTMWSGPVALPRNSYTGATGLVAHSTRWYQAIVSTAARTLVSAYYGAQGVIGQCGGPKLATSTTGASFTTCSPTGTPYGFAGEWVTMWEHTAGKVTLVFNSETPGGSALQPGVVMWREP
jgi:hypothetical protein